MDRRINRRKNGRKIEWKERRMEGWIEGSCKDRMERMDKWMDGRTE